MKRKKKKKNTEREKGKNILSCNVSGSFLQIPFSDLSVRYSSSIVSFAIRSFLIGQLPMETHTANSTD